MRAATDGAVSLPRAARSVRSAASLSPRLSNETVMADDAQTPKSPIAGEVLFYSRPEPLNNQTHGKLGLRRIDKPFAFAMNSQVAPLTVTEFAAAAVSYPIVFAGERRQPLAVMGLDQKNMFIGDNGFFDANEQLVVCIDRDAAMIGDLPDLPLFDPAGEPTDYTKNCIQFCNDYEVECRRTESFIQLLTELDLFETRNATFTPQLADGTNGAVQQIAEYIAVSEEKVKALPDAKIRELMDNGALSQIYAHLTSLTCWDKLMSLAIFRQTEQQKPANLN
jgi:hypothetical protein